MPSTSPWHIVKQSNLHGTGVFAARDIPAGTRIIEYCGARITPEEADARHPVNPDDPFHTFYFSLSCGKVIDGGKRGNDARWINHSCAPNCEAQESPSGKRVYIHALDDIPAGAELFYDYGLVMDGRITKTLREQYRCLCGAPNCRGTMLALPKKKAAAAKDKSPSIKKKDKDSTKKDKNSSKKDKASTKSDKARAKKA